jgi:hypothetical protein
MQRIARNVSTKSSDPVSNMQRGVNGNQMGQPGYGNSPAREFGAICNCKCTLRFPKGDHRTAAIARCRFSHWLRANFGVAFEAFCPPLSMSSTEGSKTHRRGAASLPRAPRQALLY